MSNKCTIWISPYNLVPNALPSDQLSVQVWASSLGNSHISTILLAFPGFPVSFPSSTLRWPLPCPCQLWTLAWIGPLSCGHWDRGGGEGVSSNTVEHLYTPQGSATTVNGLLVNSCTKMEEIIAHTNISIWWLWRCLPRDTHWPIDKSILFSVFTVNITKPCIPSQDKRQEKLHWNEALLMPAYDPCSPIWQSISIMHQRSLPRNS